MRVPLGVVFIAVARRPEAALAVLVVAGLSDVLDGWAARRHRPAGDHERHRGDWLDPLCDKLFVSAVVVGLHLAHRPAPALLLMLLARELLQGAAMLVYQVVPSLRRLRYNFRAHAIGKATTVLQFLTAVALLFERPEAPPLAVVTGVVGVTSVVVYLARARRLARTAA